MADTITQLPDDKHVIVNLRMLAALMVDPRPRATVNEAIATIERLTRERDEALVDASLAAQVQGPVDVNVSPLPCPFCGAEDVVLTRMDDEYEYVMCSQCRAQADSTDTLPERIPLEVWNMRANARLTASVQAQAYHCPHCDDTGDVHDQTGEWRGTCTCPYSKAKPATVADLAKIENDILSDVRLTLFDKIIEANRRIDSFDVIPGVAEKVIRETVKRAVALTALEVADPIWPYAKDVAAHGPWLPIETAPKDGTSILIWRNYRGGEILQAYWYTTIFGEKCWGGPGWSIPNDSGPSHWMPLPPAPNTD